MSRMTPLIIYAVFVLLICTFASCAHECPLHYDNGSSRAKIEVDVDWSGYDKENVSGMTVFCFPDGAGDPQRVLTNDISQAKFELQENFYDFLVITYSENEYGSLQFSGLDSYQSAQVNAVEFNGSHWLGKSTKVIEEPEWLAVGNMEDVVVTHEMVNNNIGIACGCDDICCQGDHIDKTFNLGTVIPKNIIYSFNIRVNISGIYNLKSVRASLSGLADTHSLSSGKNGQTSASQLLTSWDVNKEPSGNGFIESSIRTFGLPHQETKLVFDLQLMLLDGKTVVKDSIEIDDIVDIDEENKIITLELHLTEPLPDTKPATDGGFDASVNGWTDAEDFEIIM